MGYKLVAIDMDGTLLNSNKQVTDKTIQALLEAQMKGIKIVITTGRIYTSAMLYAQYIGLKTPIIACNGAIIEEVGGEKIFETFPINKETIIKTTEICQDIDMAYFLYSKDKIYVQGELKFFNSFKVKETQIDPAKNAPIYHLENNSSIKEIHEEILKLTIWNKDKEKVKEGLKRIHQIKDAFVTSSGSRNIELTHIKATKGNAIKVLAQYYGINREEIIAIGDSYNDQSMIQYAGLGVAMGNARKDIKERADYVTLSNDEEGVVATLEKFVL